MIARIPQAIRPAGTSVSSPVRNQGSATSTSASAAASGQGRRLKSIATGAIASRVNPVTVQKVAAHGPSAAPPVVT